VPGLILRDHDDVRRFIKSIKRKEMKIERAREFSESDFESQAYIDELKHYRVKLELGG
jgi:hypothetical protein